MSKNFIQPRNTLILTAPAVTRCKSGDLIIVGTIAAVAAYDADAGDEVEVSVTGVWELPKSSAQINEGAAVWRNATNHRVVNVTGAGLFPIGVAVQADGSNDATCRVRLSGIPVVTVGA
jgi:predicted RecA/RadA family phage recombinase